MGMKWLNTNKQQCIVSNVTFFYNLYISFSLKETIQLNAMECCDLQQLGWNKKIEQS